MRIALLLALLTAPVAAADFDTAAVRDDVVAWRRDIHAHPELGNRETRTAALVAKHLRSLGLEVREKVGVTGVVGIMKGGKPGPLVALRADMDALPVAEQTGLPFASKATATFRGEPVGVMHACGHDAHVAILMGVAEVLAKSRDQLAGSVMFVFQPAEEGPPEGEKGGAELMLAEGVFAKEKPAAVFGLHVFSTLNVGTVGVRPGPMMAQSESFEIVVKGRQTHGAQPWAGVDPIVAGASIVTGLQQIVSRRIDLRVAPAVVSVGQIKGGIRYNIVPDEVRILGTIRTFDAPMREQIHADIERIAARTAEASGATATTTIQRHTTVLVNDPALTRRMRPSLEAVVGAGNVVEMPFQTVAEDFALFAEQVPGMYYFVGATPQGVDAKTAPSNHSPKFDVDEGALAVGVDTLVRVTLDFLAAGTQGTAPAAGSAAAGSGTTSLRERVEAMGAITGAAAPAVAPDGRRIAYVSSRSGSPQIYTMAADGSDVVQVTRETDPVGAPAWSPDGKSLAYSVSRGGGYETQLFVADADGRNPRRITAGGKENNFAGDFAPDGRYYFTSNVRDPAGMDAWIWDPVTGKATLAVRNEGTMGFIQDIEKPRDRVLVNRAVTRGNDNLFLVDLDSGTETLLTPHDGPALVSGALAPDGSAVYLAHNIGRDRVELARIPIGRDGRPGARETLAARDDAEVDEHAVSNDGRHVLIGWNANGRVERELLDLRTGKRRMLPAAPVEITWGYDFAPDDRTVVFAGAGSTKPTDVWRLDVASGEYEQLTFADPLGIDLDALVKPELVTFRAHDGLELSGWLYVPPGFERPGPTVLSFHGGPEGQEQPYFRADYQALLANGIAVFAPNIRGSSGFGKAFLALDDHDKRFDANRDIESAAKYVVESGVGAKGRLGVMGGSYGGYAVMVGLTEFPDTFAAGANLFGIVNFETFFSHSTPWMGAISVGEYGDPKTQADLLKRLSPIHKLDRVKAATLVMHGANDTNVPVVEAEQVVSTLKKRGVPVEYVLFADEGHGWRKLPNRVKSTVALVEFFGKHLAGPQN